MSKAKAGGAGEAEGRKGARNVTRMFVRSIKSIGFVDHGACAGADILIAKRATADPEGTIERSLPFIVGKLDEEQRRVYAWAYVARKADGSLEFDSGGTTKGPDGKEIPDATARDVVDTPEAMKAFTDAFYSFVSSGKATSDDMHVDFDVARVVGGLAFEPDVQKALGIPDGVLPTGAVVVVDIPRTARGDQLWADIKAEKRKQMSIVARIERVPIDAPETLKRAPVAAFVTAYPAIAAKMEGAAATFDQIVSAQVAREKLCPLIYTLQDSLWRIMDDGSVGDKAAMLAESAGEFARAVTAALSEEAAKIGAKMSAARMGKLKAAMTAIQDILTEVEGMMAEDKTKDTEKLVAAEKRATDAEAQIVTLKAEVEALKAKAPAEAEDVWKGVSTEVRKRIEDAEKRAADAEKAAQTERDARELGEYVAKARTQFPHLPSKPETMGGVLKRMDANVLTDDDRTEIRRLLTAGDELAAKAMRETGKSGAGSDAAGAWEQIEAKATEAMKADASLTRVQARDVVMKREPELVTKYQAELRGAH